MDEPLLRHLLIHLNAFYDKYVLLRAQLCLFLQLNELLHLRV